MVAAETEKCTTLKFQVTSCPAWFRELRRATRSDSTPSEVPELVRTEAQQLHPRVKLRRPIRVNR